MRDRQRTYAVGMVALILVCAALGLDAMTYAVGAIIGPGAIVAMALRVREVRPRYPSIWYGFCGLGAIFLVSGIVRLFAEPEVYPGLPDYIELTGYASGVIAFARLVAHRTRLGGRGSISEILILPGALAAVLWNYVWVPGARGGALSTEGQLLNGTFSLLSLIWCGLVAAILFGPGKRPRSVHFISIFAVMALVGDVLGSMKTVGTELPGLDVLILITIASSMVAAGVAALDPSMGEVTESTAAPERQLGLVRLGAMAVASLAGPAILISRLGADDPGWVTGGTLFIWISTLTGVLVRLGTLFYARERQVAHNEVLTEAAEEIMAATTVTAMYAASIRAANTVASQDSQHLRTTVLGLSDGRWKVLASTGADLGDPVETEVAFVAEHAELLEAINDRRVVQTNGLPALDHQGAIAPAASVFPLVAADALRGALVVTTVEPVRPFTIRTLSALATDLSLALEGAARAEALHRERSERRFRALVDKSNDVIALLDDQANIDFIGPAVSRLLGHDESALLGTSILELVRPEDRRAFQACVERHPTAPYSTEVRLVDSAGRSRWFDIIAADHRHDPNIGGIVVTARDVHGRKIADERRKKSEARFRALVQHGNDLVAVLTDEGIMSYVSPSAERMLGHTAEDLEGTALVDLVIERHQARLRDAFLRLAARPEVPYQFELDLTTASGETRTLDITARDLRHHEAVGGVVVNARDITERKRLEQSLRHQALHDSLTGIPNRTLFHDRVEQALSRRNSDIAVFVIDIDDFKTVNDGLGHHAGDDLLKVLAFRLRQVLRVGDTAARLGGDEFAVLIEDATDRDQVCEIAERLQAKIQEPFEVSGSDLSVEGSIGIAFSNDVSTRSAEILIRGADAAMYAAKAAGKGRWERYEESMHLGAMERLHLKTDLSKALDRGEFRLWYQPVVNIDDGNVTGWEALLRWERAGLGLVNPNDFIPIAEETGLIVPIGRWVLREALTQLAEWRSSYGNPDLRMGFNVSPRQLQDELLVPEIADALANTGVPPANVAIELTETSLVDETSIEADRLDAIRRLGCDVFADDFGAGYASYAALRRLPFSGVKLDRSLIDGVSGEGSSSARAQVRSMIDMAHHLGLKVIAEGIETSDQVTALTELGCRTGQGYYFGKPVADGSVTGVANAPTSTQPDSVSVSRPT